MNTKSKKRILLLTDYCGLNTGFGRFAKELLKYLCATDKFELINAATGMPRENPDFQRWPWKVIGVLPTDPVSVQRMSQDPGYARGCSYAENTISQIVNEVRPSVILSCNDSWGLLHLIDKPFFKKLPVILHITLDSLPLLPDTITKAPDIKFYWTWSEFAEKELKRLGHNHVKTQYPLIDTNNYYPLSSEDKQEIRKKHNISQDSFIISFVFRNQLRKLVNTLIEGYSIYLKEHPEMEKKSYLLLHTHFGEGWDIMRLCDQYGVKKERILCTYACKETGDYFVQNYTGQDIENPKTRRKSLITANVQCGVTEKQLNEIYNITDIIIHPSTSGAAEMPCIESALTEKIISTCNYSYGSDIINKNKGSIPLDFTFYTEIGTQFLKSQPFPYSIAKTINKVVTMKPEKRREMEKESRKWALENYSIEKNGKEIMDFIDALPEITDESAWDIHDNQKFNPTAQIQDVPENKDFIIQLYEKILDMKVNAEYDGTQHWLKQMENGMSKENITNYFRQVATQEIQKRKPINWEEIFGKRGDKQRILYVIPKSCGDVALATSLFKSLREIYPNDKWEFHVSTESQYQSIIDGNPYVDRFIPYQPQFDNTLWLEGQGDNPGYYDIAILSHLDSQRTAAYTHNYSDKCAFNLRKEG